MKTEILRFLKNLDWMVRWLSLIHILSADGENLMVSYLSTKNGTLKSMVAFYNFGKEGQEKTDNLIYTEDFDHH